MTANSLRPFPSEDDIFDGWLNLQRAIERVECARSDQISGAVGALVAEGKYFDALLTGKKKK